MGSGSFKIRWTHPPTYTHPQSQAQKKEEGKKNKAKEKREKGKDEEAAVEEEGAKDEMVSRGGVVGGLGTKMDGIARTYILMNTHAYTKKPVQTQVHLPFVG